MTTTPTPTPPAPHALIERLQKDADYLGPDHAMPDIAANIREAITAIRSLASTIPAAEPAIGVDGVLNMAKLSASVDRETLARSLFLLNEQRDSGAPIRFNCPWNRLKSWNKATFYAAADAMRSAAPQPARETGVLIAALEYITKLSRALRQGGPDPMDLQDLSDALNEAVDTAAAALRAGDQP